MTSDTIALEVSCTTEAGKGATFIYLQILTESFMQLTLSLQQGCDDEYRTLQVSRNVCDEHFQSLVVRVSR